MAIIIFYSYIGWSSYFDMLKFILTIKIKTKSIMKLCKKKIKNFNCVTTSINFNFILLYVEQTKTQHRNDRVLLLQHRLDNN